MLFSHGIEFGDPFDSLFEDARTLDSKDNHEHASRCQAVLLAVGERGTCAHARLLTDLIVSRIRC